MKILKIKVRDSIRVTENLKNVKRWFNGLKTFSSIKILPPLRK